MPRRDTQGFLFYIYCKNCIKGGRALYYWYFPYIVHVPYPQGSQQNSAPLASRSNKTALPTGTSPYPPVNTTRFHTSATNSMQLMKQANLLVTKIADSHSFADELMSSAQSSNQKKVEEMIASTGITTSKQTTFTPDGIRIHLQNKNEDGVSCDLILILQW